MQKRHLGNPEIIICSYIEGPFTKDYMFEYDNFFLYLNLLVIAQRGVLVTEFFFSRYTFRSRSYPLCMPVEIPDYQTTTILMPHKATTPEASHRYLTDELHAMGEMDIQGEHMN